MSEFAIEFSIKIYPSLEPAEQRLVSALFWRTFAVGEEETVITYEELSTLTGLTDATTHKGMRGLVSKELVSVSALQSKRSPRSIRLNWPLRDDNPLLRPHLRDVETMERKLRERIKRTVIRQQYSEEAARPAVADVPRPELSAESLRKAKIMYDSLTEDQKQAIRKEAIELDSGESLYTRILAIVADRYLAPEDVHGIYSGR